MLQKNGTKLSRHCSPSQAAHAPTLCHDKQDMGTGRTGEVSQIGIAGNKVIKQLMTYSYVLETGLAFLGPLGLV